MHVKNDYLKSQPRYVGELAVAIMEARGLPKMDRFGDNDAYCEVAFAGMLRQTEVAKDGNAPFWNAEFTFQVESRKRGLQVTVYDQELRGEDEPIGSVVLPVTAEALGGEKGDAWAAGMWRPLEPVPEGPKLTAEKKGKGRHGLGEIFIKVTWVPPGAKKQRLKKVTPKMGWGALKEKAKTDQEQRVAERGPMDVASMVSMWKKGAPMKARMGAAFAKVKKCVHTSICSSRDSPLTARLACDLVRTTAGVLQRQWVRQKRPVRKHRTANFSFWRSLGRIGKMIAAKKEQQADEEGGGDQATEGEGGGDSGGGGGKRNPSADIFRQEKCPH